ncbi:MAG TPA: hypothetical protein VF163_21210 [Micromonosporaceae bacterium]
MTNGTVWLIVIATVVLGLAVLIAAASSVAGRMRPLRRSVFRLRLRAEQAQRIQTRTTAVQERALAIQASLDETAARWEQRRLHDSTPAE